MDVENLQNWRHLCVDMQRMFAEDTPWHVTWMERVLPQVGAVTAAAPERTIFTRFMPPASAGHAVGTWRDYYRKWWMMTGEHLAKDMPLIVPELAAFVPPARIFDKPVYSPWFTGELHRTLQGEGVTTLVVSGGETDVCVMATVLGAIDLGYRVLMLKDAVCSGTDETHDASLELLGKRFSVQLEVLSADDFLRLAAR